MEKSMRLLFPTNTVLDTATDDKPGISRVLRQSHLQHAVCNDSCPSLDVACEYLPLPPYDASFLLRIIHVILFSCSVPTTVNW